MAMMTAYAVAALMRVSFSGISRDAMLTGISSRGADGR
jgi:hypothetical protein